jgi:hypothetical protein
MLTRTWPIIAAAIAAAIAIGATVLVFDGFTGEGTLAVAVHDSPCADCVHVWVTFDSVAVRESDIGASGWTTVSFAGTTVDLETLNGSAFARVIATASLRAGHYQQVRLTVSHVAATLRDGRNVTASIPQSTSADVDGAFALASGTTTTLSIDIDLVTSLQLHVSGAGVTAMFTPKVSSVSVL